MPVMPDVSFQNPADATTPAEELVGTNVPEFFAALKAAASQAHGYYWAPMVVWRFKTNRRRFMISTKKDASQVDKKEWEKITTVTPSRAGCHR